jgi:hypothetical protein
MKIQMILLIVFFKINSGKSHSFKNEQFINNPGIYFKNISPLLIK